MLLAKEADNTPGKLDEQPDPESGCYWKTFSWRPVTSSLPQGSVLGPILFNSFLNLLDDWVGYTLDKFDDDMTLEAEADTPEGYAAILRDLDVLGSGDVTPKYYVQFWAPSYKKDTVILEHVQSWWMV